MKALLNHFLLFSFLFPALALAQLFEVKEGGKWGLINKSGKTVLPVAYDYVYSTEDREFFFIRQQRKTGLFNPANGTLIQPRYDLIFPPKPNEGSFFKIVEKGKYGLLDSTGKLLIPPQYNEIQFYDKDYFTYRKDRYWGLGSNFSSVSIPPQYQIIIPFKNKNSLFFLGTDPQGISTIWDEKGKIVASNIAYSVVNLVGETFIYQIKSKYGLLNKSGQPLTEAIYDQIYPSGKLIGVKADKAYGLFSSNGQIILPPNYTKLRADSSGRVWFQDGSQWGVVGLEGDILAQPQFSHSGGFIGPISTVRQDSVYGVLNQYGEFLVPAKYDEIKLYAGMVRGRKGKKWDQVLFDDSGKKLKRRKLIITKNRQEYEFAAYRALIRGNKKERAGWFQEGELWGLRDTVKGDLLIKPVYGSVEVFEDLNLSIVTDAQQLKMGRKRYGLVNHITGERILKPVFRAIFPNDLKEANAFRVWNGKKIALASREGNVRNVANAIHITAPYRGIFRVKTGGNFVTLSETSNGDHEKKLEKEVVNWKLINEQGNLISQPTYTYIGPFYEGIATARKSKDKKTHQWVLIDTLQKEVSEPLTLPITDLGSGSPFFMTRKDTFTYHLLDSMGNFLVSRDQFWMNPDSQFKMIDEIENFREGMARVKIGNKWGFMNTSGKIAIPPQYSKVNDFYQELAAVRLKKGWGYINKQGTLIIKPKYRQADNFHQGRAAVRTTNGWGYIDERGRKVLKFKMKKTLSFQQDLGPARTRYWGLVDLDGKWVIKPAYGQIQKSGNFWKVRDNGMFGFVDENGIEVLKPRFTNLGVASEDRVSFMTKNRYGFLNMEGEKVIPASYRAVEPFSEGLAGMNYGGRWGYINKEGVTIVRPIYEEVKPFIGGVAAVFHEKEKRWGVIDKVGETVLPFDYSTINRNDKGWLACLNAKTKKWEYFDPYGIRLSHRDFENATPLKDGMATFYRKSKKNIINIFGIPITYPGYDDITKAGKEVIVAENNSLAGLIDRRGDTVLPPIYESIEFIDNIYRVTRQGEIGYLTKNGTWLYPLSIHR